MRSFVLMSCVLLFVGVVGGCASADKRFKQGSEMEAKGQFEMAVMRYVQALEKEPGLEAARIRLIEAGNLAIGEQLSDAGTMIRRGDPVSAARHFQRADSVVAKARTVGVRLDLPADYETRRHAAFDGAFDALIDQSVMAREQGRWQEGVASARRAQQDFEPTLEQRNTALAAEAGLYADWSQAEFEMGHLRNAFDIAGHVQSLEWSPPEAAAQAAHLMEDCLVEGERELIVLPVQGKVKGTRKGPHKRGLSDQIEDALWRGPWRQPPAFITIDEPLTLRTLLAGSGLLNRHINAATMALILRLAEADYGAYVKVISSEVNEFDIRTKTRKVKTRQGQPTTFVKESGQRRVRATVRVLIADGNGNEIANEVVSGSGTAPFARGVYEGDPRTLNLNARQLDLFDAAVLADQELAAREDLARDLAHEIAAAVFGRVLAQVP